MLQQLLIQVKVNRAKVKRSRKLGGPAYDAFSDVVTELYHWLDSHSIGEIEVLFRHPPSLKNYGGRGDYRGRAHVRVSQPKNHAKPQG